MRALTNLSQIATGEGRSFLSGERQADVKVYENHSILIHGGRIAEITRAVPPGVEEIDCGGGVAVPGFVDPHTHIAFAGNRVQEFYMRIRGTSYLDILRSGNGIYRTIRDTVNADENRIFKETISRVWSAVRRGTTTMEMKTGYGLDQRGEEKILSAIEVIKNTGPISVVPTYLAHVVPQDVQENAYVEGILETVKRNRQRISYADIFCDAGAFSPEASRRFLEAAIAMGIPARIHTNEIENVGCVKKTRGLPIVSYDHMIHFDDADLDIVKENGSSVTLLPITVFALNEAYPDARRIIDRGIPVSIATDISPLNMNDDMIFAMHLAVRNNHMNAEEVLNAATINPAASLGLAEKKGTIESGKDADLVVLSARSYDEIPYLYGLDIVSMTISRGNILYSRGDHGITDTSEA
ncbi:ATRAZINE CHLOROHYDROLASE related protein [Thermoplasma acidophilum]|uniref:Imidazolonepropionase n=1 Tax=Thermoplasma acidophilum (strain ATCC 25905 / DSM 1728 / JCM 9062 / NBRC 15155 / AMRC-C165) TaxID=273075 RepID=HUTI_THEAC|nr:imidazolonepropionase [Thermoplasma acidophilum]Q9HLJ0.1 RecName: Full=Imidazolonepropionase; AltName: Full=Imidazolone-5-propionate hydrolase [Thermoplasma acidophilum DSM 1728]CAC11383.1 ATRAZINE CHLOROHYDROLASE related protein [Thermoplasma acidophilum]